MWCSGRWRQRRWWWWWFSVQAKYVRGPRGSSVGQKARAAVPSCRDDAGGMCRHTRDGGYRVKTRAVGHQGNNMERSNATIKPASRLMISVALVLCLVPQLLAPLLRPTGTICTMESIPAFRDSCMHLVSPCSAHAGTETDECVAWQQAGRVRLAPRGTRPRWVRQ